MHWVFIQRGFNQLNLIEPREHKFPGAGLWIQLLSWGPGKTGGQQQCRGWNLTVSTANPLKTPQKLFRITARSGFGFVWDFVFWDLFLIIFPRSDYKEFNVRADLFMSFSPASLKLLDYFCGSTSPSLTSWMDLPSIKTGLAKQFSLDQAIWILILSNIKSIIVFIIT